MWRLKKVLLAFLCILVLFAIITILFFNSLAPTYQGENELNNLTEQVEVYFDPFGIPHIYATNEEDAFRALGYVHAQDRLWQMELLRRVAKGRLSEVFGEELVDTDKFFLSLGIAENTSATISKLDKNSMAVKLSTAYIDGINQFIDEGPTPVEFYLTGLKKEHFSLHDVLDAIGYMAFSFAMAHKTDPLLTNIGQTLGAPYLNDLKVDIDANSVWIKNHGDKPDAVSAGMTAMVSRALEKLPIPQFIGSNSWVIAPEKTKNGKVILANDPHIGFAQPSVWYEAHMTTPSYEKYGYHLAGVPFPLLGHDRTVAYGLTMFENDDIDFYYEQDHPTDTLKYKTEQGWQPYSFITKEIKVKDRQSITFTYRTTRHGPILNGIADQISEERPVSMAWTYTKAENRLLDALYGISHAKDRDGFQEALPMIHAPGLNVMYGDSLGNVAWWASAKLYRMPDSTNTKVILNGATGEDEPLEYLNFSENPQAINPPWHYVYSANNQPDSISGMLYPGYYLPENRAKRIVDLLEEKNDWDTASVSNMIIDITSSVDTKMVPNLVKLLDAEQLSQNQAKQLDALLKWKGDYPLESVNGTIFHRWMYQILKMTFLDELGNDRFEQFLGTHFMKRLMAPFTENPASVWWDDITTANHKETQDEIVQAAFHNAWMSLERDFGPDVAQWKWERVHTLEHHHPIGQVAALRSYFNVGPFPVPGSREVINNLGFSYNDGGYFRVGSGPSTRRIIDFSDVTNSISILPTGQSGNPLSPHYKDQAELYAKGKFRKMMMDKKEIQEVSKSLLIFIPLK